MPPLAVFIPFCLGALLLASLPQIAVAAGNAVIRGASSLNVRSGPGREYSSFATLQEGSTVEVEATEGSWVRIRTREGETGYVHKAFVVPLDPEEEARLPAESDSEVVAGTNPVETAPAAAADAARAAGSGSGSEMLAANRDVLSGQQRLERLVESLQADVKRLLETNRQQGSSLVASGPAPTPVSVGVTAVDATESGSLLGLSIVGLVAGFVLGTIYGRRQERGRRTRVRF
jgi:hypothetical protein